MSICCNNCYKTKTCKSDKILWLKGWDTSKDFCSLHRYEFDCPEVKEYKVRVVAYALDELEKDIEAGGITEKERGLINRLRYWILEEEVTQR